ncbi:MAG: hypothetical protein V1866_03400 [archaeon]
MRLYKPIATLMLYSMSVLTGCSGCSNQDQKRPVIFLESTWIPPNMIYIEADSEQVHKNLKRIAYGDLPPRGSLDYVLVCKRDSDESEWSDNKVFTPKDKEFAFYKQRYNDIYTGKIR